MPWSQLKHSGLVTDLPPAEVGPDVWTYALNIRFALGVTRRAPGFERYAAPPSAAPLFAINLLVESVSFWIYCSDRNVYVTDGTAHYDITPSGGLNACQPNEWTGCILNGVAVLNNPKNKPMFWAGNTGILCQYLPGWPAGATCGAMRAHKYHLFALAVEDGGISQGSTLWWSNGAEPGAIPQEWVPTVSNDAGDMVIADSPGSIIDGMSLRDNFVVYKQSSVYMLSYVAGQYVYTQRKLFLTDGIAARNCVAEHGGNHYVLTGSDVMMHDGQNVRPLLYGKIQSQTLKAISAELLERCWLSHRRLTKQLHIGIPTGTAQLPNQMISIDLESGECGVESLPETAHLARGIVRIDYGDGSWDNASGSWDSDSKFWNEQDWSPTDDTLLACMPGEMALMAFDTIDTRDGSSVFAAVEKTGIQLHDGIERVLVKRIALRIEGQDGDLLQVQVGGQSGFGAPIEWSDYLNYTIGTSLVLHCLAEGRLIAVRVQGSTLKRWYLHSYKLEWERLGLY